MTLSDSRKKLIKEARKKWYLMKRTTLPKKEEKIVQDYINTNIEDIKKDLRVCFTRYELEDSDIQDIVESVKAENITPLSIGGHRTYLFESSKGCFWKSGILISDLFNSKVSTIKDAQNALL